MLCATTGSIYHGFRAHCMPPSTQPLACCRWWPAATAVTSAACPPRSVPIRWACPVSLSTTAIRVGLDSLNAASVEPAPGWARQPRPSRRANAPEVVRRACSPLNAATATTHWTRRVPCGCFDWSLSSCHSCHAEQSGGWRPTPRRSTSTDLRRGGRLRKRTSSSPKKCQRAVAQRGERSDNTARSQVPTTRVQQKAIKAVTAFANPNRCPRSPKPLPWPPKLDRMTHDWLLVETLGGDPAVVAQGRQLKNLVPITTFMRRNPHLSAVRTAIAESMQSGQSLTSITPKHDRVIRTEPVVMSDGRLHGVHVWTGPADEEPPERPIPGPLKWDLTLGVATDTRESLTISGKNPDVEVTFGRAFAEDLPTRELNPNETKVLAMVVRAEPGLTLCSTWDLTDWEGNPIRIGFVGRSALEPGADGREHLVARAMNWRAELK